MQQLDVACNFAPFVSRFLYSDPLSNRHCFSDRTCGYHFMYDGYDAACSEGRFVDLAAIDFL